MLGRVGLLFWNKTELYGEGTLRSNSHCVCLGFFGLGLGHLNIFFLQNVPSLLQNLRLFIV